MWRDKSDYHVISHVNSGVLWHETRAGIAQLVGRTCVLKL